MNFLYWLIVIVPISLIIYIAFYSKRYVRDIADYLASGRVAGRYVLCVGDLSTQLSVLVLVGMCEQLYRCGMALSFWQELYKPVGIVMALTGFCVYRYRQTRCLSMGQFLEIRYSRPLRFFAATVRTLAEMITNAIAPAIAVKFFIYFLGLPTSIALFGYTIPTYTILVTILLLFALSIIWPAGRISLLITDSIQGIISYPIFVVFTVFILTEISWFTDVQPVMINRAPGENFLNPFDVSKLRDFNLFSVFVVLMSSVIGRPAWIGNDTSTSAKNPHEQKMAGILGTWRSGFAWTMMTVIAIYVIVFMNGGRFDAESKGVRENLASRVAEEIFPNDKPFQQQLSAAVSELTILPAATAEAPYSQHNNRDTIIFDTVREQLELANAAALAQGQAVASEGKESAAKVQEFRTTYNQMMMPIVLKSKFPPALIALFTLLMLMLLVSTDDSRIFNASSTIIQDIVIPLKKRQLTVEEHIKYLKIGTVCVVIFFWVVALFFTQLDYINMFIQIMTGIWVGAAGPIMLGGLYTRVGTTAGAWAALVFGSGFATFGLIVQRTWASIIYPFIFEHGWHEALYDAFVKCSSPFVPWIDWSCGAAENGREAALQLFAEKFPVTAIELNFISMVLAILSYVIVSMITCKEKFNLDRLLHRNKYAYEEDLTNGTLAEPKTFWQKLYGTLIGITPEYTKGDKVIAWSVFAYSIGWNFICLFVVVLIWNSIKPFTGEDWSVYFFITTIVASILIGSVSTVWFLCGGVKDLRRLFIDLKARVVNPLDNGQVVGHTSIADAEKFKQLEEEEKKE